MKDPAYFLNVTYCVIKISCYLYCTGLMELLMFSVLTTFWKSQEHVMLGFCPRYRMLVLNGSHVSVIPSFLHHGTRTTFKQLLVYSVEKRNFCFTEMFCTVIFKHFHKESFLPTAPSISISELFSTPLFIGLFYCPFWFRFYLKIKGFLA